MTGHVDCFWKDLRREKVEKGDVGGDVDDRIRGDVASEVGGEVGSGKGHGGRAIP